MVFRSAKQRKAFFAFSYIDGRKLGSFTSLQMVFKKFPKEEIAFNRVKKFNKRLGTNLKTTRMIPSKLKARWDK